MTNPTPPAPQLPAWLDHGQWHVWCEFEWTWHYHGAGPANGNPLDFLGHRGAHCVDPASPLHKRGYVLVAGEGPRPEYPKRRPTIAAQATR